jgi:hypothetical protein
MPPFTASQGSNITHGEAGNASVSSAIHPSLQHESAKLVLDATALPLAMQYSTLTEEDWRLMLISLDWVHQRFSQHPENSLGYKWFCRTPESLAMLLHLHPKLVKEMQQQWPTLNELLVTSPVHKGLWKSLMTLKQQAQNPYRRYSPSFLTEDGLYPLKRWMQHQSAWLEVLRLENTNRTRTLVHSIGLPIDEDHAYAVDVITIPDLSLLLHASLSEEDEAEGEDTLHASRVVHALIQQLGYLMPHHHVVVWDSYTASLLMEFVPDFPVSQLHITHPCWLMELPSQLAQREREGNPHILEHAFHVWCYQHGWVDTPPPQRSPEELAEKPALLEYPEFLIVSLRDSHNEDFIATLTLAYTIMLDALALLPKRLGGSQHTYHEASHPEDDDDEEEQYDDGEEDNATVADSIPSPSLETLLAQALVDENGEALVGQGKRHLICLYTPGQFQEAQAALEAHPLTHVVKDRIRLVPSTPLNKALLYPKAMAYGVIPLGRAFYPTLLEAMAYTLPVIAPRHVCFDTLLQEGGILYDPADVTTLPMFVQKLTQAGETKSLRPRYMARKAAETRSWQRFGEELFKVYNTIFVETHD